MLIVIDNYDSFTYNLVQYLGELGAESRVFRNDEGTVEEIKRLNPARIVISPGPCTPNEAGISVELVKKLGSDIPMLGVCLGHQSIAQCYGGKVVRAKRVMHGKTSEVYHQQQGVFHDLPNPFEATRYHSLIVLKESLPAEFEMTAWTQNEHGEVDEIMGIKHKTYPLQGVQFHPESILTRCGHDLLRNFLQDK